MNKNELASSIAKASIILFIIGIAGKIIGFLREIIYANNFGLSSEFDLFLTVSAIPIVINTAVLFLSQHYFIPSYNRIKNQDFNSSNIDKYGDEFFNYTFWWFLISSIAISLGLVLLSQPIMQFYLSSVSVDIQNKGTHIFLLFLLTIPINACISVITAYLQANFNFIYPVVLQLVLNLIIIVIILLFTSTFGIYILPLSFILGYIIVFILISRPVLKKLKFTASKIFITKYQKSDINILISLIFIEGFSLSYILADRYFIGVVPEGGIAALNYATVIYLLPITIFSIPLITTIFSKFSQSSVKTPGSMVQDFISASKINIYIIIPSIMILIYWGEYFLRLFYERGQFKASDTIITHQALQYYCLGLVFYSSYLIVVKLLYSLSEYFKVLIISIIALLLKIALNFILVSSLEQNGLALSTSLIYIFLFLIGFYFAHNKLNSNNKFIHISTVIYFLINAILSYIASNIFILLLNIDSVLTNLLGITIFLFLYVINSCLLEDNEFNLIKDAIIKFLSLNRIVKSKVV